MAIIHFKLADGQTMRVEGEDGTSVMEAAVTNNVPGIDADCGGACACATCQVYVESAWLTKLPEKTDLEKNMLEFAVNVQPNSRLSCRIPMTTELDGLEIWVPASQTASY
jgi:2Fe-2S ferredoxin